MNEHAVQMTFVGHNWLCYGAYPSTYVVDVTKNGGDDK